MVRNMISQKIDLETICQITGLSKEEIEKIK